METSNKSLMTNENREYQKSKRMQVKDYDIWMLGICIVIGGQYFSWNTGASAGFGNMFISMILISSGYITLCFCVSELTSGLPFAGGAYGLARCTLGYYMGFLVGCSESVEYIAYTAAAVYALGSMISSLSPDHIYHLQPLIWLLFYVTALVLHIYGGRIFWRSVMILAVMSFLILLWFCLGSLPWVDFPKNAVENNVWFVGGGESFMWCLPLLAWFYVGVESLNMASDSVEQPKRDIPRGQIACVLTLFVTGILTLFVTCSFPPGMEELAVNLTPFNIGFAKMFRVNSNYLTILSLPATYATAYGFMFSYGKLIHAMADSRLLPAIFKRQYSVEQTPYMALIIGSALGYGLCFVMYYSSLVAQHLFDVCILSAFVAYLSQCVGYIFMQTRFQNISREFHSPLGVAGAVYSICVWLLCIVAVIGFRKDGNFAVIVMGSLYSAITVYYFTYAKWRQTFSEDERKIMFVAHVINFNNNKTKATRRRKPKANGKDVSVSSSFQSGVLRTMHYLGIKSVKVNIEESLGRGSSQASSQLQGQDGASSRSESAAPMDYGNKDVIDISGIENSSPHINTKGGGSISATVGEASSALSNNYRKVYEPVAMKPELYDIPNNPQQGSKSHGIAWGLMTMSPDDEDQSKDVLLFKPLEDKV